MPRMLEETLVGDREQLEGGWEIKLGCLEGFAGKSKDPKEWGEERPEALVYLETVLQTEGTAFAKPWRQSCRSWGGGGEERAGEGSVLGEERAGEVSGQCWLQAWQREGLLWGEGIAHLPSTVNLR